MSMTLEHDYIGLSETMESHKNGSLNLKATELRLGLPGCESPERDCGVAAAKTSLSVKRGFSDAISEKWVFSHGSNGGGSGDESEPNNQTALRDAVPPESPKTAQREKKISNPPTQTSAPPASKAQVVGWPPIRASRKNMMSSSSSPPEKEKEKCVYVKVSMDGAPYLRKVDLNTYTAYSDLSKALEKMFTCFTISQCGSSGGVSGLSKSTLMDLLHGSEFVLTYEDKDGDWMLVGDVPWKMFTESCKRLRIMKSSDAIGLAPRAMEKCKNRN